MNLLRIIAAILAGSMPLLAGCSGECCLQDAPAASAPATTLQVYYFHRTVRCPACNKIEELAQQAVETFFPVELEEQKLRWQPANVDEAVYAHFVEEFSLSTQSLVLADIQDGKQTRWKNLERIWELLDDEPAFLRYVETEIRAFFDQ